MLEASLLYNIAEPQATCLQKERKNTIEAIQRL